MDRVDGEVHRELVGWLDNWILEEVIGVECLFGSPAIGGIECHEFRDEVNGVVGHPLGLRELISQSFRKAIGESGLIRRRLERLPQRTGGVKVRPVFGGGVPTCAEDEIELRRLVGTAQKARAAEHLGDDAPDAPHVNLGGVLSAPEQEFRRAVPQRNDADRQSLHLAVPAPGQAPIGDLEFALLVDEEVGRLEVPVDDFVDVHVVHARQELLRP